MAVRPFVRSYTLAIATSAALSLACVGSGCDSGAIVTRDRGATIYYDLGVQPDVGTPLRQAGDPCPEADCFSDKLLCIGGVCRIKCVQPKPGCNHAVTECPAGESCLAATTFSDACFPATGKLGDVCDASNPCSANYICVQLSGPATCLALCSLNCQSGEQCLESSQGCKVCVKP